MKWTYDWLIEYLKTNASAAQIADTLTRIGLEVEDYNPQFHRLRQKSLNAKRTKTATTCTY